MSQTTDTAQRALVRELEFDHVVELDSQGHIVHGGIRASDVCVPEVLDAEPNSIDIDGYPEWELITQCLTGQYGYSGPWLHDSEQLEGAVVNRVLEFAKENGGGLYVAIYASYTPECPLGHDVCQCADVLETEIEGWAIAHMTNGAK